MTKGQGHSHGGPDDGAEGEVFDWFRVFDVLVWVAVGVVVVFAAEYLAGAIIREKISAGAQKYLRQETKTGESA